MIVLTPASSETLPDFLRAFDTHEHDRAHASVELLGDRRPGGVVVGTDLLHLHHEWIRARASTSGLHRADKTGKRGERVVDAPLHRSVEDEVAGSVAKDLARELRARLWLPCGGSASSPSACRPCSRRVEPEHRHALLV